MLIPFWGNPIESNEWIPRRRFKQYLEIGRDYFELVSDAKSADFLVLPADWKYYLRLNEQKKALDFANLAGREGKKVLVFYAADDDKIVPLENSLIFRTSLNRSKRLSNEYSLPGFCGDLLQLHLNGMRDIRPKNSQPSVGFCGNARLPAVNLRSSAEKLAITAFQLFKNRNRGKWWRYNSDFRGKVLKKLENNMHIETNFIIRNGYYYGVYKNSRTDLVGIQNEFFSNVIGNDYTLCIRGAGNYSMRFYETLCCGRIPIFINTDSVLPFQLDFDWSTSVVWVEESEWRNVGEKLLDFHSSLSSSSFIELQHKCRSVWENYLAPEGFFANLHRYLIA
jgi:hypothetical protein